MSDKVALVTGGSTGIGAEICRQLLDDGYEVLSLARRTQRDVPARLRAVTVDLTDAAATAQIARELAAEYPITTIVHNAGAILEKPLEQVSAADLTALTQLHVGTAIALVQANLQAMRARRFGRGRARLDQSRPRACQADRVLRHQSRPDRTCTHLGAGACARWDHRERGRARTD